MDKQFKFSEQPAKVKAVYAVVVAILCITAVVVGIMSVASQKDTTPDDGGTTPPVTDGNENEGGENEGNENEGGALSFVSPTVGEISKYHSTDTPVFSNTLGEWRIHTGIDISAAEGADVHAVADGTVTKVFNDHFHGKTVEITHSGGIVSVYSNLSNDGVTVKEGDSVKSGAKIGVVGDTSLTELADESHLHFEVKIGGVSVNPLDYISEDSKKASLGM